MATSKEDIKHGTAQAKLSDDETTRAAYKHDTVLESGKIADSDTIDLFAAANNISGARRNLAGKNESGGVPDDGKKTASSS